MQENTKERILVTFNSPHKEGGRHMDSESRPSEKDFMTLTNSIEQLNECATLLKVADQEIASTIAGEDKLEVEIIESAAIQKAISGKLRGQSIYLQRLYLLH